MVPYNEFYLGTDDGDGCVSTRTTSKPFCRESWKTLHPKLQRAAHYNMTELFHNRTPLLTLSSHSRQICPDVWVVSNLTHLMK